MDRNSEVIDSFRGPYFFLSNFYEHDGRITAEHLFQSMKTNDSLEQLWVLAAPTPGDAKFRGNNDVKLREGWDNMKLQVMECILAIKFAKGTVMSHWLQDTGNAELIEGNNWKDDYWGVYRGKGTNHLGRLLMERREKNRRGT